MAIKTALGGLEGLVAADAGFAALVPSGVWTGSIPSEKPLPFVALQHKSATNRWTSEAQYLETTKARFEVFAEASKVVGADNPTEQIADLIRGLLDATRDLGILNAPTVSLWRGEWVFTEDPKRGPDDERVYKGSLDVEVTLQRLRTLPG